MLFLRALLGFSRALALCGLFVENLDVVQRNRLGAELILVPFRSTEEVEVLDPVAYCSLYELSHEHNTGGHLARRGKERGVVQIEALRHFETERGRNCALPDLEKVQPQPPERHETARYPLEEGCDPRTHEVALVAFGLTMHVEEELEVAIESRRAAGADARIGMLSCQPAQLAFELVALLGLERRKV